MGPSDKPNREGKKFSHSVCVPQLYKESSKILKRVKAGEGLKSLVYNSRRPKQVNALLCNCLRNESLLDKIFEETGFLTERLDADLAKILVTELLWGKESLQGDSKPVKRALQFQSKLVKAAESADIPATLDIVQKPRCVRINTLKATVNGTIQRFVDEGWEQVDTPETYKSYIQCISNLNEGEFVQDYHFDDVLMFHPKTQLFDHKLVLGGILIQQDKASCLPVRLLNPEPGSVVLDMCAAPGIKTAHLANLMNNKGTLFAVDRIPRRYETMSKQIQLFCGINSCVELKCADAVHLSEELCPNVQYILVDPTCTGTGMTQRIEDADDITSKIPGTRIQHLAGFQERLLIQALTAFPDVERVVYSTCSILPQENEEIIQKVLSRVPSFRVVPPKLQKHWEHRSNSKYTFGPKCVVASYDNDRTNGFFVAILERVTKASPPKKQKPLKRKMMVDIEWQFPRRKIKKGKKEQMDTGSGDEREVDCEDNEDT